MTHTCGSCTACCTLVPVAEIKKASFTRCEFVRTPPQTTTGCAIYPKRPPSCQQWSCIWLTDDTWPDELRPDRCGFVFDPIIDIVKLGKEEMAAAVAWVGKGAEDNWQMEWVGAAMRALIDQGLAVLMRMGPEEPGGPLRARLAFMQEDGTIALTEANRDFLGYDKETVEQRNARTNDLIAKRRKRLRSSRKLQ